MLDNFVLPLPPPRTPSAAELDELTARVLVAAKRPMLWLGSGARRAGEAVHRLLDLGFTMITSFNGRATVPRTIRGASAGCTATACRGSRVLPDGGPVLAVGSRLRGHETDDFAVKLPGNLIQIDTDPMANGRTYANRTSSAATRRRRSQALLPRIEGRLRTDPAIQRILPR